MDHPLQHLYDKIPPVACKGLCQEACGPIGLTRVEMETIMEISGDTIHADGNMTCSALCKATGTCKVYEARPLVCRLYGAAEGLECPYGCNMGPIMPEAEAKKLILAGNRIGKGFLYTF